MATEEIHNILFSQGKGGKKKKGARTDREQCSLIFRGHINMHDYRSSFRDVFFARGAPPPRVFYLAFLREPVSRAISEYRHITEGIVAQFGPVRSLAYLKPCSFCYHK